MPSFAENPCPTGPRRLGKPHWTVQLASRNNTTRQEPRLLGSVISLGQFDVMEFERELEACRDPHLCGSAAIKARPKVIFVALTALGPALAGFGRGLGTQVLTYLRLGILPTENKLELKAMS